jgi:hypothetical protein
VNLTPAAIAGCRIAGEAFADPVHRGIRAITAGKQWPTLGVSGIDSKAKPGPRKVTQFFPNRSVELPAGVIMVRGVWIGYGTRHSSKKDKACYLSNSGSSRS